MTAPTRHKLLKIFTGPHAGAEALLSDGQHTVGSGDDVDIMLSDHFIEPHHLTLNVSGDRVGCEVSGEAGLLIDGRSVTGGELEAFQYFTLGSTHLAIGPADEAWPVTTFPEFQLGGNPLDHKPASPEKPVDLEDVPSETKTPRRGRLARGVITASALLFFLAVGIGFMLTSGSAATSKVEAGEIQRQIQAVIQDAKVPEGMLELEETRSGWLLTGYVPDKTTKKKITDGVKQVSGRVSVRIRDCETMLRLTDEYLTRRSFKFSTELGDTPGEVLIAGVTDDISAWQAALERLPKAVPMIRSITNNVVHSIVADAQHFAAAGNSENDAGQSDTQTRSPADQDGELGPELKMILTNVLRPDSPGNDAGYQHMDVSREDNSLGSPRIPMADIPRSLMPEDILLPLEYRSVSIGGTKSITLANGQKLFEGARISNGYTVTSISLDRIVVSNGKKHRVHFLEALNE